MMKTSKWLPLVLCALVQLQLSCSSVLEDDNSEGNFARSQKLELTLSKLHILAAFDRQLNRFASSSSSDTPTTRHTYTYDKSNSSKSARSESDLASESEIDSERNRRLRHHRQQLLCRLPLPFRPNGAPSKWQVFANGRVVESARGQLNESHSMVRNCLSDSELRGKVPPYMMNLHSRLLSQSRSLPDAVRLMPYESLIARSFSQPSLEKFGHFKSRSQGMSQQTITPDLVVELSALDERQQLLADEERSSWPQSKRRRSNRRKDRRRRRRRKRRSQRSINLLPAHADKSHLSPQRGPISVPSRQVMNRRAVAAADSDDHEQPQLPCNPMERSRPAHLRSKICYAFEISPKLISKLNGSHSHSSALALPERLVEAELHLYKLKPEFSSSAYESSALELEPDSHFARPKLKTNLLEVSLYQVLPIQSKDKHKQRNANSSDFPLRLLDIRRLDLYASGWETFYVKRAVADWIREPSTNLGLVIKAKSMFDEPIRIGLIRFVDLYELSLPQKGSSLALALAQESAPFHSSSSSSSSSGNNNSLAHNSSSSNSSSSNSIVDEEEDEPHRRSRQLDKRFDLRRVDLREEAQRHNDADADADADDYDVKRAEFNLSHQPILVIYTTIASSNR